MSIGQISSQSPLLNYGKVKVKEEKVPSFNDTLITAMMNGGTNSSEKGIDLIEVNNQANDNLQDFLSMLFPDLTDLTLLISDSGNDIFTDLDIESMIAEDSLEFQDFITNLFPSQQINLEEISGLGELLGLYYVIDNASLEQLTTLNSNDAEKLVRLLKMKTDQILTNQGNDSLTSQDIIAELTEKLEELLVTTKDHLSNTIDDKGQKLDVRLRGLVESVYTRYFTSTIKHPDGGSESGHVVDEPNNLEGSNQHQVWQMQQMHKVEQLAVLLDSNKKTLPTQEQFIKEFQNIIARRQFSVQNGQQKLLIKLYPEHLGSLQIELIQNEDGIVARIIASTKTAKDLLDSQLTNLRQAFQSQNIPIEKVGIETQYIPQQQSRSFNRDNQQQQSHQNHGDTNSSDDVESQSFLEALKEELVNLRV